MEIFDNNFPVYICPKCKKYVEYENVIRSYGNTNYFDVTCDICKLGVSFKIMISYYKRYRLYLSCGRRNHEQHQLKQKFNCLRLCMFLRAYVNIDKLDVMLYADCESKEIVPMETFISTHINYLFKQTDIIYIYKALYKILPTELRQHIYSMLLY
jgi:hypothetical protein